MHTGTRVKVKEIDNESSIPWKTVESIHPERSTSTCGARTQSVSEPDALMHGWGAHGASCRASPGPPARKRFARWSGPHPPDGGPSTGWNHEIVNSRSPVARTATLVGGIAVVPVGDAPQISNWLLLHPDPNSATISVIPLTLRQDFLKQRRGIRPSK